MSLKKSLLYVGVAAMAFTACQNQHADLTTAAPGFNYDSLSYKMAKAYVKNYEKHAGTVDSSYEEKGANKIKKRPNTRCVWFSADRLQALLTKIKSEGGDGIRFYLASYDSIYPKTIGGLTPPRAYWGYNTLVMVSTKDSTNKVDQKFHRDYYTSETGNTANKPVNGFILGGTPENRGELCPPPRDCGATGATLLP
jgi:hypothetical protein